MKFCVKTYGCQMNVYDSDSIENSLIKYGYKKTEYYDDADIIILNTCNIREKATEKLYSELGRISRNKIAKIKDDDRYVVIAVIGCVSQAEGNIIKKRSPLVDIVLGSQSYHLLHGMIEKAFKNKEVKMSQVSLDFVADNKFDFLREELIEKGFIKSKPSSFVTIQEGCDRFCTFCVVPYTRGPEVSRKVEDIIQEVKILSEKGTKEIVLLGQNVNAYSTTDKKGRKWNLAYLISKIAEIKEIERIKYTTSHPCYMDKDLIAVHAFESKLSPVLNLPIQSGSDRILKLMNRKHKAEDYLEIISKLQKGRPEIVLSSDFIVGFPTETEEDFLKTLEVIKEVFFKAQSFCFKYSIRPGTPAEKMEQVNEEEKSLRLKRLQNLLEEQRQSFNEKFLDKEVEILFDNKESGKSKNKLSGRTEFNQIAIIDDLKEDQIKDLYGRTSKAIVKKVHINSMTCELIENI